MSLLTNVFEIRRACAQAIAGANYEFDAAMTSTCATGIHETGGHCVERTFDTSAGELAFRAKKNGRH